MVSYSIIRLVVFLGRPHFVNLSSDLCVFLPEDKQWYRAKILAYSSEERVCVGYLDFGNSEEVDLGNLQPISTSLLALPMQAMPCGLAGIHCEL